MSDISANSSQRDHETRMERAAESSVAKIGARIVTPVLLTVTLVVLGALGNSLIQSQQGQAAGQADLARDVAAIKSDVRDTRTVLSERVIRQIDSNSKRIDGVEQRLQVVERTVMHP